MCVVAAMADQDAVRPEAADEGDDYDDAEVAAQQAVHTHSTDENEVLHHIDVASEVIELNNLRIFSLDEIPLATFTNCTLLEIRKNLLHRLDVFPQHLRERLDTLDLFDNKLRSVGPYFSEVGSPAYAASKLAQLPQPLPSCRWSVLRKLDLSYNQIKVIAGLDDLAGTLEELYLVENRIKKIEGLAALTKLKLLELGGNGIREVGDGLATLVNLEQLWLGKNKIATIGTGLQTLGKLKRLSLQANRLTAVPPEAFPEGAHPALEELYLSENGITEIANVRSLRALTLLDFSFNPIKSLYRSPTSDSDAAERVTEMTPDNFPALSEFWLTDGELDDWQEVELLRPFEATLDTVYLERNPLERDKRYRGKIVMALPFIRQIDSWPVVNRADPDGDRATRR